MGFNVLSLFDGISCGRVALERAGIKVDKYFASEIDKRAIEVSKHNYPDILHIGDIFSVDFTKYIDNVDIIIGGSPCQFWSIAKAGRETTPDGEGGKLFLKFKEAIDIIRPKYFLYENNYSISSSIKEFITKSLGVPYIVINSNLVSAQNRARCYWTNIPGVVVPDDKGIFLKDILESGVVERVKSLTLLKSYSNHSGSQKYLVKRDLVKSMHSVVFERVATPVCLCMKRTYEGKRLRKDYEKGNIKHRFNEHRELVPRDDNKSNTLTTVVKDNLILFRREDYSLEKTAIHTDLTDGEYLVRPLTPIECERLQTLPNVENKYIIRICLDNQKNSVSAESQNLKLPSVVGSVENDRKRESVLCVEQNSNANNLLLNNVVLPNVQVSIVENRLAIRYQNTVLLNASFAEILNKFPHLKAIVNFARVFVLIDTIVAQTTSNGKVELQQKEINLTQVRSGDIVVKLCGNEITPLAKYATEDISTIQKLLNATILYPLSVRNIEQTLRILFYYVANVICSFIPEEIQRNCILNIQTDLGYTFGVAKTQRYKQLGNAWTVDVIAHIFSFIPDKD